MRALTPLASVLLVAALVAPCWSATICGLSPALQGMINSASGGSTVTLAAGTYSGACTGCSIVFPAGGLTVVGHTSGTTIDCQGAGTAFTINSLDSVNSIKNIYFTGASTGAVVLDTNTTVSISGCTFANNVNTGNGGAISVVSSTLSVTDTTFSFNTAFYGAVLYNTGTIWGVSFSSCYFVGNTATTNSMVNNQGGILHAAGGPFTLQSSNYTRNVCTSCWAQMNIIGTQTTVVGVTFTANTGTASSGGSGFLFLPTTKSSAVIQNLTFTGNNLRGQCASLLALSSSDSFPMENFTVTNNYMTGSTWFGLGHQVVRNIYISNNYKMYSGTFTFSGGLTFINMLIENQSFSYGVLGNYCSLVNVYNSTFRNLVSDLTFTWSSTGGSYYIFTNTVFSNITVGSSMFMDKGTYQILSSNFVNIKGLVGGTILRSTGGTTTMTIDGSTFTNITSPSNNGGAVSLTKGNTLKISNSQFYYNSASNGGVLYFSEMSATITGSLFDSNRGQSGIILATASANVVVGTTTFRSNTVTQAGGVFFAFLGSYVNVSGSTFLSNYGASGGGFYLDGATAIISGSTIKNNTSPQGGFLYNTGVALVTISGSTFIGNSAYSAGAIYSGSFAGITISGSNFVANAAVLDGAAVTASGPFQVNSTLFQGNAGTTGALTINSVAVGSLSNCNFTYNQGTTGAAVDIGGTAIVNARSLWLRTNSASDCGGGMAVRTSGTVTLLSSYFIDNTAVSGGGICQTAGTLDMLSTLMQTNTVSGAGAAISSEGTATLTTCTLSKNSAGTQGGAVSSTGPLTITNSQVLMNTATTYGGGVACDDCAFTSTGTSYTNNKGTASGGAFWCPAGTTTAASFDSSSTITGNVGGENAYMQADCAGCGCCEYSKAPTIVTAACMPSVGRTCSYNCATGYNDQGVHSKLCPSGLLAPDDTCPPIPCPVVYDPKFGNVTLSGRVDATPVTTAVATFVCQPGYFLNSTGVLHCIGPNWQEPIPGCNGDVCSPDLSIPANGNATRTHGGTGDVAEFSCQDGYQLVGQSSLTCISPSWNGAVPVCSKIICAPLAAPGNGTVKYAGGRSAGENATYVCNPGYSLNGNSSVVFCIGPDWSDVTPVCDPIACPALVIANGAVVQTASVTGGLAAVTCDSGYAQINEGVVVSCIGPNWVAAGGVALPSCTPVTCPPISYPRLSDCANDTLSYLQICQASCVRGYRGQHFALQCQQTRINGNGVYRIANLSVSSIPQCNECAAGTYSADSAEFCTPCLNGNTPSTGNTDISDCECNPGYYEVTPHSGTCARCPTGANCDGGRTPPYAALGYFQSGAAFVQCFPAVACLTNNTCQEGYRGYACGLCIDGYYKSTGRCFVCPKAGAWKITVGSILAAFVTLILIPLSRPSSSTELAIAFASVNIALNFVQISAEFALFRLPWPPYILSAFSAMSALNLNIELTSPDCVIKVGFYEKYVGSMVLPLVILALYFFCSLGYIGAMYCLRYRGRDLRQFRARVQGIVRDVMAGYGTFLNLAYLYLSRTTLSLFSCRTQADGKVVLALSPSDLCYTAEWHQHIPVAALGFILYIVGIPLLLFGVTEWQRRKFGPSSATSNQPTSFFVKKFELSTWYWEIMVMARKLFIVVVVIFLVDNTLIAVVLACGMLFLMCVLTSTIQPYRWDGHDFVDLICLLGSLAILFSGLVVNSPEFKAVQVADGVAVTIVAIALIVCFMCFVYEIGVNLTVRLQTGKTTTPIGANTDHADQITCMAMLQDGARLVSGGMDGVVLVWDRESEAKQIHISGHNGSVTGMAAFGVRFLLTASEEKDIKLWDSLNGECLQEILLDEGHVTSVHAFENNVVTAMSSGKVTLWRVRRIKVEENVALSASDSAGGAGMNSGSMSIHEADRKLLKVVREFHSKSAVVAVRMSHLHVMVACEDNFVRRWLRETSDEMESWHISGGAIRCMVATGSMIVVGGEDARVRVLDTKDGSVLALAGHTGRVNAVDVDGDRVFSASQDGTMRVWSIKDGENLLTIVSPALGFSAVDSQAGMVRAGTVDGVVVQYDLTRQEALKRPDSAGPCVKRLCRRRRKKVQVDEEGVWTPEMDALLCDELKETVQELKDQPPSINLMVLGALVDGLERSNVINEFDNTGDSDVTTSVSISGSRSGSGHSSSDY